MTTEDPSASSADNPTREGEALEDNTSPASTSQTQDAPEQKAESSAAEGAPQKPASLLDVVKSVAGENAKQEGTEESPPTDAKETASNPDNPDSSADGNPPSSEGSDPNADEEGKGDEKLPFHTHPRFQELIREKNTYKGEAEQFRAISTFMSDQGLQPEDVNQLFQFGALLKNDPRKALEMLTPIYSDLQTRLGEVIPDDIAKMLDDGELTEAAARELAKARADRALIEQQAQERHQRQQQQAAESGRTAMANAVVAWEQQITARDPDYNAKRTLVLKLVRAEQAANPASTPEEAVAIAEAAYREATEILKGTQPRKPELKQPTAQQTVPAAPAQPKSLQDVVRMATRQG